MKGMDAAGLDRLHDIVVPPPVAWWPPAPGWYLLAALAGALIVLLLVRQVNLWRANAYRRAALVELRDLSKADAASTQPRTALREAAEILKRTALVAAPRQHVARLSGHPWIDWLDRHGGGSVFPGNVARLLEHTVYESDESDLPEESLRNTITAIEAWIVHHRIEPADSDGN